jgi:hypothetical protein
MRNLILALGTVLCFIANNTAVRAEEPKANKPTITEKQWQEFVESMNPFTFIQRMREAEARVRVANNLRQLQLKLHDYAAQGPQPMSGGAQPFPPTWIQQLLPYIDQDNLYSQFSLPGSANRLGIKWERVGEAMQSQLSLAANKGLLVVDVDINSAAARAGLKKFDILLQWDGKEVTDKPADFQDLLNRAPEKKEIAVRVLRGGKEVDIKGISLPATGPAPIRTYLCPSQPFESMRDGTSNTILFPYSDGAVRGYSPYQWTWPNVGTVNQAQSSVFTTTYRQEDRFTARYQEGSLVITITGQMKNDVATVKAIKVIDGATEHRYESIDKTPEEYRDKARSLAKAAEKNQDRIEIQKGQ